ncbi:MAG: plastocyanin/azurin family copper-binding protein [Rudaea sp.]
MTHRSRHARAALLMPLALSCQLAFAATVVNARLMDPSSSAPTSTMQITLDRDTVPAGKVTFRAVNESKDLVHELIVVRTDAARSALPYDDKHKEVIEKRIHHLGEIPDLKPGAKGTMTLDLKPGPYLVICNQPGHYKAGMVAALTVTR